MGFNSGFKGLNTHAGENLDSHGVKYEDDCIQDCNDM